MGVARPLFGMTHREEIDIDLRDIDERILDKLEEMPSTRQHLASELDVTGEYVYQRVDLLIKLGVVERIHDGFYRLAEDGTGKNKPDADIRTVADQRPAVDEKAESEAESTKGASGLNDPERAAIEAAVAFIREQGSASKREIVQEVMPEHDLGYDVGAALEKFDEGERYRGAWWRKKIKPGLEDDERIAKPPRGGSEWTYIGEYNE